MGILKDIFKIVKDKKTIKDEEKFNKLSEEQKEEVVNKLAELQSKQQESDLLEKKVAEAPYIMPYLISKLNWKHGYDPKLVSIALENGISIYDLLDKNKDISNDDILNFAVETNPEIVFEIEDKKQYSDLITRDSIIKAFQKNPQVIFADLKVFDEDDEHKIVLKREEYVNNEQKEFTRKTTLRKLLKRALNLYFRPEAYSEKQFDGYAMEIASQIKSDSFVEKVEDNKMTTRVITAANETLKRNPEKGRVVPGSVLHMHKNRVMYVIPNQAKKNVNKSQENYKNYRKYMHGLLENSALKLSQTEEKVRIVKRSVSIVPELFFDLKKDEAYRDVLNKLTVQLSAFEAFKNQDKNKDASTLLTLVGAENEKKILSRAKANKTRKANKNKKAQAKNAEAEKEIVEEKVL